MRDDPDDQTSIFDYMVLDSEEHHEWSLTAIAAAAADAPIDHETEPPRPPSDWVYFIQEGVDGPIKIGYSAEPWRRLATIQTGTSKPCRYLGNVPGTRANERELHHRFRHSHVRGEWFAPTPDLLEFIDTHRYRGERDWKTQWNENTLW